VIWAAKIAKFNKHNKYSHFFYDKNYQAAHRQDSVSFIRHPEIWWLTVHIIQPNLYHS